MQTRPVMFFGESGYKYGGITLQPEPWTEAPPLLLLFRENFIKCYGLSEEEAKMLTLMVYLYKYFISLSIQFVDFVKDWFSLYPLACG
jgi:hypothetical protein